MQFVFEVCRFSTTCKNSNKNHWNPVNSIHSNSYCCQKALSHWIYDLVWITFHNIITLGIREEQSDPQPKLLFQWQEESQDANLYLGKKILKEQTNYYLQNGGYANEELKLREYNWNQVSIYHYPIVQIQILQSKSTQKCIVYMLRCVTFINERTQTYQN